MPSRSDACRRGNPREAIAKAPHNNNFAAVDLAQSLTPMSLTFPDFCGPLLKTTRPDVSERGGHECPRHVGTRNQCEVIFVWSLSENAVVHVAGRIGEPEVTPGIAIRQLHVIEAHQRQHRGVEVVNVHAVFRGVVAKVVGGAVDVA